MSRWQNIEPSIVRRSFRDHPWLFAWYCEGPEERDDEHWYHALIFRDQDRSMYGSLEFPGVDITVAAFEKRFNLRALAARIVTDAVYRATLLSDSPQLPVLWRKH